MPPEILDFLGFRKHLHNKRNAKSLDQFENEPVIVKNEPVIVDVSDEPVVNLIPEQPENSQSCNETKLWFW